MLEGGFRRAVLDFLVGGEIIAAYNESNPSKEIIVEDFGHGREQVTAIYLGR